MVAQSDRRWCSCRSSSSSSSRSGSGSGSGSRRTTSSSSRRRNASHWRPHWRRETGGQAACRGGFRNPGEADRVRVSGSPIPGFYVGQGRGGSDSESDPVSIWILNLALRRQLAAGGNKIAGDVGIRAVEAVVEYQLVREQQQQRRQQSAAGEQPPQHMCESNRFRLTADRVAVLFVRSVALDHSPPPAASSAAGAAASTPPAALAAALRFHHRQERWPRFNCGTLLRRPVPRRR